MEATTDLARKRPATVIDTRPVRTYHAGYLKKADLTRAVNTAVRRGQVRPLDARPTWNQDTGQWEMRCRVLKPDPPAWRHPMLVAGAAAAVLVALCLLGWLFLATLAAMPLLTFCLLALAALGMAVKAGKPRIVEVTTVTTVRVR